MKDCNGTYADGTACDNCNRCFQERKAQRLAQNAPNEVVVTHVEPEEDWPTETVVETPVDDVLLYGVICDTLTGMTNRVIHHDTTPERRKTIVAETALSLMKQMKG